MILFYYIFIPIIILLLNCFLWIYIFRKNKNLSITKNEIKIENERLKSILNSIGYAIITTDNQMKVTYMNPVAEKLTGWNFHEAKGLFILQILLVINEITREPIKNPFRYALDTKTNIKLPLHSILVNKKGMELIIDDNIVPLLNDKGEIKGLVIVFHEINEKQKLFKRTKNKIGRDKLTGLVDRLELINRLQFSIKIAEMQKNQHTLYYLDIDNFNVINTNYGYKAGDEVIKEIASLLNKKIRKTDTLAKTGEDEYGILLLNCPINLGMNIAEDICTMLRDHTFIFNKKKINVTVSIGVVSVTADCKDVSKLLIEADKGCNIAQEKGGDIAYLFQEDDIHYIKYQYEVHWISRINKAFDENRFCLFFQPVVSSEANYNNGDHYEILIRMIDENNQIIEPSNFLPSAERYNLMPRIDRWVIEQFFILYRKIYNSKTENPPFCCSINLSGASMNDNDMLDFIIKNINKYNIPPCVLCFEITESIAISNFQSTDRFIKRLKEMGCSFALDDFGNGLSSFNYLKLLTVDFLKIDGSFIKNIANEPLDFAVVKTINTMGHYMGLKTIAEYVKDKPTYEILMDIGVNYLQGYYISKPKPLKELYT